MASNILSIGQSALAAAQVGISTTGHNIANASTPGYSRQVVIQGAAQAQNFGYGYVGQGTQINTIMRVFNELQAKQVASAQSSSNELAAYSAQMRQIDNMLSDSSAGLSPAVQDFFNSIQTLSANPGDASTRQAMLSSAEALASRFHNLGSRLSDLREGVNTQLTASVTLVNTYANQIAKLNDVIEKALSADGNPPNDLMDQRDQLIAELSKEMKTTVVSQDGGKYNVFIGNGLPLVVGTQTFSLTTMNSPTDATRLEVAYEGKGKTTILGGDSLAGGTIGGLSQFRSESLDGIQNQLGLIAVVLAQTFNEQHMQALDATGKPGGAFFAAPSPVVSSSGDNAGNADITSQIVDAKALTSSNYRLQYDGSNYIVTRLTDGTAQTFSSLPQTVDGFSIQIASGAAAAGDDFLIQPSFNGASTFSVNVTNTSKIAVGAPTVTGATVTGNTGSGVISSPTVTSTYAAAPLSSPFTLTYASGTNTFSGFPAGAPVTVTVGSTSTTYPAGTPVPYTAGATIEVSGVKLQISGAPNNGDQFTVTPTASNGSGDNRNALLLAALQTSKLMGNGTASYEGAFNQLVSVVGNKSRELQVTSTAQDQMLEQAIAAHQAESGVNLDEEATNLLRYQQAYQAAGKMMQIASQMFEVLLTLGRY
ncbi:MAG TPA: flagellar hook-associated protein FlgK [Methylophilaceae bacterium]|nr:flagellar hook-associated protein FlgK [Methylophilaceae bacterium]